MLYRRSATIASALFLTVSTAPAQEAPKLSSAPMDAASIAAARDTAKQAREAFAKGDASAKAKARSQLVNIILYTSVECNAPNGLGCTGNAPMEVDPGFQACKPIYNVAINQGSITANFAPDHWFTVDPLEPVSFKKYIITMTAHGASHLRYTNVGIAMLPAEATSVDRAGNKCDFFTGPKF